MTYIMSPLAGLGGGISWWAPAYSLLLLHPFLQTLKNNKCNDTNYT